MKGKFGSVLALIGIISSSSSVISFIQHVNNIKLYSIFGLYVNLYRDIFHPLVNLVPWLFGISIPDAIKDIWVVNAIISVMFYKSIFGGEGMYISFDHIRHHPIAEFKRLGIIFLLIVVSVYFSLAIFFPLLILMIWVSRNSWKTSFVDARVIYRAFFSLTVAVFSASVVFFILNAFVGYTE
jgi:hypothetical protein